MSRQPGGRMRSHSEGGGGGGVQCQIPVTSSQNQVDCIFSLHSFITSHTLNASEMLDASQKHQSSFKV